ncbi:trehalose-phosphatase [Geodermatophilus poikilotrophus]|uniref:Trehalose 6-phosphate phosphatase n=1 Tax=Geodermatophilus poikilotrophus TaxID=1333667 RepID=A0A1I0GK28_9ACTN|nr:trehalose-phosphatase [Geodermatophilus poikilotrophus]SET70401.1 trehalose 6-phosphate phosphatase [Geodermatophilus poikilotrophus]
MTGSAAPLPSPAALPAELAEALTAVAGRRPLLVASDYDGVLAPLVGDPSAAVPLPGVAAALQRLAAHADVVVALVSGRGVADLRAVSGFEGPYRWIGSHGAEYGGPLTAELAGRRDVLAERLAPLVAAVPGARLEVKPASVAVHVRQVTDRAAAATLLEQADAVADPFLTKKPGKEVLELAVTDADKGSALLRLRGDLGAAATVYLGDDRTDEDAFRVLSPGDLTVKVGEGETAARYRIPDPAAVVVLLETLAGALD